MLYEVITYMVQSIMILLGLLILLFEVLAETKGIAPIFANQSKDFFDLIPHGGLEEWSAYIALLLA